MVVGGGGVVINRMSKYDTNGFSKHALGFYKYDDKISLMH